VRKKIPAVTCGVVTACAREVGSYKCSVRRHGQNASHARGENRLNRRRVEFVSPNPRRNLSSDVRRYGRAVSRVLLPAQPNSHNVRHSDECRVIHITARTRTKPSGTRWQVGMTGAPDRLQANGRRGAVWWCVRWRAGGASGVRVYVWCGAQACASVSACVRRCR